MAVGTFTVSSYSVSVLTGDSVTIALTGTDSATSDTEWVIPMTAGGTTVNANVTLTSSTAGTLTATGLTANTTYSIAAGTYDSVTYEDHMVMPAITFTTDSDDPKIATESQWGDLARRVKERAKITMQNTDPGEGVALAANEFIGVYNQPSVYPSLTVYDTGDLSTSSGLSAWAEFPTSLSLPAGTYLLLGTFQGGSSASNVAFGINCGGDIDVKKAYGDANSDHVVAVSLMGVKTITSTTSFFGFVGQWTSSGAKYHLTAIKIA